MSDLLELFKATDTLLNIHLLNSTSQLKFRDLSNQLKPILGRCVALDEICQLITVYPGCYKITEMNGVSVIDAPDEQRRNFGQHVMRRRCKFSERLKEFNGVPVASTISEIVSEKVSKTVSTTSIDKEDPPKRKHKVQAIKKDASEFEFKECEPKRKKPLLERIREKERLKKEQNQPEDVKGEIVVDGKSLEFYNVLYSSVYLNSQQSVMAFDRLLTILKDSSPTPIGIYECEAVIERISEKLHDKVQIVRKQDKKYVKIANLNRDSDLSILRKSI